MTDLTYLTQIKDSIATETADRRGEILRRTIDLFVVGAERYSDEEIALFDDVLTRLAVQIETSARALLAVRLAPIKQAPPKIVRALAFDEIIEVAGPILTQSERLDDAALVENAQEKGQQHLLAISKRRTLSETVTDVLVERGDQQVVLSTARNSGAKFSESGFTKLVLRSEGDDALAECVGSRPEIPPHLFLVLLAKASKSVQAKLEAAHPYAKRQVQEAVEEVTNRIRSDTLTVTPSFLAAWATVEKLHKSRQLDGKAIETYANAGKFEETTTALALMCDLPLEFIARAMTQDRSETVLILARAVGLSWSAAKAIMTLRATKRPMPAGEMAQALASYERLRPNTAQDIVRFYRTREQGGAKRPS